MAMRFEGPAVANMLKDAFGIDMKDLTPDQLRFVVNVAKHVRTRCRSNAALRNYLSANFGAGIIVQEVDREWKGRAYKALQFTSRAKPELTSVDEDSDEENGGGS